jgi:hypothetical protein
MARKRKTTKTEAPNDGDSVTTATTTKERKMAGLNADQIKALLGKTRQKGLYVQRLNEFLASGEAGISVKETWVEFADKKDTTLKQGFDNAKENKEASEGSENVKVIANEGDVFLINLAAAADELGELAGVSE